MDSQAADAHRKMLHHPHPDFTSDERSAWIRFVISLLLRSPNDVRLLIKMMRSEFFGGDEAAERKYQQNREPGDPPSRDEFLRQASTQDFIDRGSLRILTELINHRGVGTHMINMRWHALTIPDAGHHFLTSDRPVIMTNGMDDPDAYIMLPISPTKAFLAVNQDNRLHLFQSANQPALIKSINKTIVFCNQICMGPKR